MVDIARPKFVLGQCVATPAALSALQESGQSPSDFISRHVRGDWGQVSPDDAKLNDEALVDGSRILSAYKTLKGVKFWVLTEATGDDGQRASTCLLLPDEY